MVSSSTSTFSKRKPRPSGRGSSGRPGRTTARVRPAGVVHGARQARKSNRESRGHSPPTWTRRGHIPWGENHGTEPLTVLTEPLPVPGVGRQRPRTRGGDGTPKPAPFAVVYPTAASRGRVRSMARPVSLPAKSPERTYSFGRSPLLQSGDRAGVEPQAGESVRTGVVTRPPPRRGAHEPGTPSGEEVTGGVASDGPTWFGRPPVSRHHETAKPFRTTPRWNPRASARGGCQTVAVSVTSAFRTIKLPDVTSAPR